jgi:hypothetical protein
MRAFHFYIDDWLSSKHIRRMDAHEERGYLRLLLYAASEPDCGLPDDDRELADISLLNQQWNSPTKDLEKQFGDQTSGQKLRDCFFVIKNGTPVNALTEEEEIDDRIDYSGLVEGRLYNARLLREFLYQQQVAQKRSEAGRKSGESRRKTANKCSTHVEQTDEQNSNNDVCVSVSVPVSSSSFEKKQGCNLFEMQRAVMSEKFWAWWRGWSAIRGTNHKHQAEAAWTEIAGDALFELIVPCTQSYLVAYPAGTSGYNPENFLREQAKQSFEARWPARASPGRASKRTTDEQYADGFERILREREESEQRKIYG